MTISEMRDMISKANDKYCSSNQRQLVIDISDDFNKDSIIFEDGWCNNINGYPFLNVGNYGNQFYKGSYDIKNIYDILILPEFIIDRTMWEHDCYNEKFIVIRELSNILHKISWGLDISFYNGLCWDISRNLLDAESVSFRYNRNWDVRRLVGELTSLIIDKHGDIISEYSVRATKWANFYFTMMNFYKDQELYITENMRKLKEEERKKKQLLIEENYRINMLHESSGIYFIRDFNGMVKIGQSSRISKRFKHLDYANSHSLNLIAVIFVKECSDLVNEERNQHLKYDKYWVRREWFKLPEDIIDNIVLEMSDEEKIACDQSNRLYMSVHDKNKELNDIEDD